MKTREQHPSYVQEPLEAWPSSFLDSEDRPKLLSPAACLFNPCSSVILQFSLSWWKMLHIFGLNNTNPTVTCNNRGNVSREFRHTTQRGFWALPQHLTKGLLGQSAIQGFVCLWNPKTQQGNPTPVRTPFCLRSAQFFSSHCSGRKVFLISADKSVALKRLLCALPSAEFCGCQLYNCSVTWDNTQTSQTALKIVQCIDIIKSMFSPMWKNI